MKKELVKNQAAYFVTFNYHAVPDNPVDSVIVLGDFNEWSLEDGYELKKTKSGNFEGKFKIPAGRDYHFRYLVNGNRWANEKDADKFEGSPLHPHIDNSVLSLPAVEMSTTIKVEDLKKVGGPTNAAKSEKSESKKAAPKKAEAKKAETKPASKNAEAKPTAKKAEAKPAPKKAETKAAPKKAEAKPTPKKAEAKPAPKKTEAKPAAKKASAPKAKADDLTKIEGIGPKIAELLKASGIDTFDTLAATKKATISQILETAGTRFAVHDPSTWAQQSKLAAAGKWDQLKKLQDELKGGK